jgi:hypothetical protein
MKILTLRRWGSFGFSKRNEGDETPELRSRRLAKHEAFWYLLAFYTTWSFPTIVGVMELADAKKEIGVGLWILFNTYHSVQAAQRLFEGAGVHSPSILAESRKVP